MRVSSSWVQSQPEVAPSSSSRGSNRSLVGQIFQQLRQLMREAELVQSGKDFGPLGATTQLHALPLARRYGTTGLPIRSGVEVTKACF